MNIHLHNRAALLYSGTFDREEELAALLQGLRIDLRVVEEEGLSLSLAALAGYANAPQPARPFEGEPPAGSCLVFSGLTEQKLNRALAKLAESELAIDYKAVLTNENRDWAFGTLMQELQAENEIKAKA